MTATSSVICPTQATPTIITRRTGKQSAARFGTQQTNHMGASAPITDGENYDH